MNPRAVARVRPSMEGSRGDIAMRVLCLFGALVVMVTLADVAYEVIKDAYPSISKFGVAFLGRSVWAPNLGKFGALPMIIGTVVVSAISLVIAAPVGIAIALYLALMAPKAVRTIVGPLIEMLAAIPSVILGFWGIIVMAPVMHSTVEPALHSVLGWIPIFGTPGTTGLSVLTAGILLSVMVIPIIASLCRDLFLSVPRELRDGAEALGSTNWEVIRGVILPTTFSGVSAAIMLGLGRALGEAIAVAFVIGSSSQNFPLNTFAIGNTLSARIALEIQYIETPLQRASLYYLALILLVMGLAVNLIARAITNRYDVHRTTV